VVLAILLAMNFFEARKEKRVQKRTGGGSWL